MKNNKLISKRQQILNSERLNILTGDINKTALSLKGDKRMQSIY